MLRRCKWSGADLVFFIFPIFFLFATASSFAETSANPRPAISLNETNFDFGNIVEGAAVTHDFSVANKGTSDLQLDRVVAACGCTAATLTANIIKPGEEGKIRVTMDSRGMVGKISKAVRIYSNDPDNSMSVVSVSGVVDPEVRVEPANLFFDRYIKVAGANAPSQEVSIRVNPAGKLKILSVESPSKFVKVEEKVKNENERKVVVSIDPSVPLGELRDRIIISLTGGARRNVNIPVFVSVKPALTVEPTALSFGVVMGDKDLTKRIKLESFDKEEFLVNEITSSDPAISAKALPIKEGHSYWIEVTLNPKKVTQDLRASLTIKGSGVLSEPLSLNVYGVLPPKL